MSRAAWYSVLRGAGVVAAVALALPVGRAAAGVDIAWSAGPSLALPRTDIAVAATSRRIYALGGTEGGGHGVNVVEALDVGGASWMRQTNLLGPRCGAAAATGSGLDAIVVGGSVPTCAQVIPTASAEG